MLTLEYVKNGESTVFSVSGPVLVEGNLPPHLLNPTKPTLEAYVRHVAESPANLMSLGRIGQGLRILDEVEMSPDDILNVINRDSYPDFEPSKMTFVEVTAQEAQDYRLDTLRNDAPTRGKRVARSCGQGRIWVSNPAVTGGGYCRKLPQSSGSSPSAPGSRFTTRQKLIAASLAALAVGGAGAAGGLAVAMAQKPAQPQDKPKQPTTFQPAAPAPQPEAPQAKVAPEPADLPQPEPKSSPAPQTPSPPPESPAASAPPPSPAPPAPQTPSPPPESPAASAPPPSPAPQTSQAPPTSPASSALPTTPAPPQPWGVPPTAAELPPRPETSPPAPAPWGVPPTASELPPRPERSQVPGRPWGVPGEDQTPPVAPLVPGTTAADPNPWDQPEALPVTPAYTAPEPPPVEPPKPPEIFEPSVPDPWADSTETYSELQPKNIRSKKSGTPGPDELGSEADFQRRQAAIARAKTIGDDPGMKLYQGLAEELESFKGNSDETRELERQIYEAESSYASMFNPMTEPYFQKYGPTVRSARERLQKLKEDSAYLSRTVPRNKRQELIDRSESLLRDIDLGIQALDQEYPTDPIQDARDDLIQKRGLVIGVNQSYRQLDKYDALLDQQEKRLGKLPTNRSQLSDEDGRKYDQMLRDHKAHKQVGKVVMNTTHSQADAIKDMGRMKDENAQFEASYKENKEMAVNAAQMGVPKFVEDLTRKVEALDLMSGKVGDDWVMGKGPDLDSEGIQLIRADFGKINTIEDAAAFREYAIDRLSNEIIEESGQIEKVMDKPKRLYRKAFSAAQQRVNEWKGLLWKATNGKMAKETSDARKILTANADVVASSIEGVTRESEKANAQIIIQEIDSRQEMIQIAAKQGLDAARDIRKGISEGQKNDEINEFIIEDKPVKAKTVRRKLRAARRKAKRIQEKFKNPLTYKTQRIITASDRAEQEVANKMSALSNAMIDAHQQLANATRELEKVERSNTRQNAPTNIPTDRLEAARRGIQLEIRKLNAQRRSAGLELEMLREQARRDGYTEAEFPILGVADVMRFDVEDMAAVDGYDLLVETSQLYYDPDVPLHLDADTELDVADYLAQVYAKK